MRGGSSEARLALAVRGPGGYPRLGGRLSPSCEVEHKRREDKERQYVRYDREGHGNILSRTSTHVLRATRVRCSRLRVGRGHGEHPRLTR